MTLVSFSENQNHSES